jgi:hypothetical protein
VAGNRGAIAWLLSAALFCLALPSLAATREERVQFAAGASSTEITGSIAGSDSVEYLVGAEAGQEMSVSLVADNAMANFNLFAPGDVPGESTAFFVGPRDGTDFRGALDEGGDYRVQVFLMRAGARRGESAGYTLRVSVAGAPEPAATEFPPDFADGLMGGPDFWDVTGLAEADRLNLRAGPSIGEPVLERLASGTVLRNHGCRMADGERWCEVSLKDDPARRGWVAGRYLRESAAGAGALPPDGQAP